MRSKRALLFSIVLGVALPGNAIAQAPPEPEARVKAEARDRFERAMRLFNENDNAAALAELTRVYELVPNPVVLLNIGLVYSAMGRPVEAVRAFDRLLAAPGSLSAERLARAREARSEQAARVGSLVVTVNVEGASIEVDGLEAAKAPAARPLEVSGGTHIVGAVAVGYAPARKEVTVAGLATATVRLDLTPLAGRLAHLTLKSRLPGASVVVDGAVVGRTPLSASLTVAPGQHRVELTRPGYVTARQDLLLGEGASGELSLEPEEDPAALATEGGMLALSLSQPRASQALVTLDGRPRGVYVASLRVARGAHRLRVERAGFLTYERDVEVARDVTTTLDVELYPGAEALDAYTSSARFHRRWGWIGVVGGALLTGGGVAVLAYNAGPKSTALTNANLLESQRTAQTGPCDLAHGARPDQCNAAVAAAEATYSNAQALDGAGYALGGAGLVVLGTGIVLLVTGDDPHRYERKPAGELFAGAVVLRAPSVWRVPGGAGVSLTGAF